MLKARLPRAVAVCGIAVWLVTSLAPHACAALAAVNRSGIDAAMPSGVTGVRWRGHHDDGGAIAPWAVTPLFLGGVATGGARPYDEAYYGWPSYYYGYGPGYYGPGYGTPPPIVYTPGYGDAAWLAYCSAKYRSFDPLSGTYLGHDSLRYYCR